MPVAQRTAVRAMQGKFKLSERRACALVGLGRSTYCYRPQRLDTVVGDFTRACLAIEVDTSLGGRRVVPVLQRLIGARGKPTMLFTDNGPEFISRVLDVVGVPPRHRAALHRAGHAQPERLRRVRRGLQWPSTRPVSQRALVR